MIYPRKPWISLGIVNIIGLMVHRWKVIVFSLFVYHSDKVEIFVQSHPYSVLLGLAGALLFISERTGKSIYSARGKPNPTRFVRKDYSP